MYGITVEYVQNIYGNVWNVYEICMEYGWNILSNGLNTRFELANAE